MVDLHLSLELWPNGRDLRSIFSLVRVFSRGVAVLLPQRASRALAPVVGVVHAGCQLFKPAWNAVSESARAN